MAPGARRQIRVLILSLLLLFTNGLGPRSSEAIWFEGSESHSEVALMLLIWAGLLWYCGKWMFQAWHNPTGKSDRMILLLFVAGVVALPFDAVSWFIPEDWSFRWECLSMLIYLPLAIVAYRKTARRWSVEGYLLPLTETGPWPSNRNFGIMYGLLFLPICMDGLSRFESSESPWLSIAEFVVLLVIIFGVFMLGWRYLRSKKLVT